LSDVTDITYTHSILLQTVPVLNGSKNTTVYQVLSSVDLNIHAVLLVQ